MQQFIVFPVGKSDKEYLRREITPILIKADMEFVPPLHTRNGTGDQSFNWEGAEEKQIPSKYIESVLNQNIILARSSGKTVGLLSYKPNAVGGIYITTVVVDPDYRNQHLAVGMYQLLFAKYPEYSFYVRTWTTNEKHIRLLEKLGFDQLYTQHNNRKQGIGTIMFERVREKPI